MSHSSGGDLLSIANCLHSHQSLFCKFRPYDVARPFDTVLYPHITLHDMPRFRPAPPCPSKLATRPAEKPHLHRAHQAAGVGHQKRARFNLQPQLPPGLLGELLEISLHRRTYRLQIRGNFPRHSAGLSHIYIFCTIGARAQWGWRRGGGAPNISVLTRLITS